MKHIVRILILTVMLAAASFGVYYFLPPSQVGQEAVKQLASVHTFSFGPVGYAAIIPESENQFFAILSSRHSSRLFCDLYESGTPEAKFYALCGLHLCGLHLLPGEFNAYSQRFGQDTTNIEIMSGCFGHEISPTQALSFLRSGAIERYLPLRQEIIEHARTNKPAI